MRVDQVLVAAAPRHAVPESAFSLVPALRQLGPSRVYARHVHPEVAGDVRTLDQFPPGSGDDLLVVHASIGEPGMTEWLLARPERLVVVYHNISPSSYYRAWDPAFARLLDEGRAELALLRDRAVLALADSRFNAAELEDLGYRDVRVAPLVVDASRLRHLAPHEATARHLAAGSGPLVVFVGQLLPHKRPDLLIAAYHVLSTYHRPEARLALVGPTRLPRYRLAIQTYIDELNLYRAAVVGEVSDAQLAAYYRAASVFVTASEHEGFCIPLLEAMAFDLPVVARDYAAIPETLDDAGVVLPARDDPLLMAEAILAVLNDAGLRERLRARGKQRLADFGPEQASAAVVDHLRSVA